MEKTGGKKFKVFVEKYLTTFSKAYIMSKLNRRGVHENVRNAERAPPKNGPDGVRF